LKKWGQNSAAIPIIAAIYFVAGKLGLLLAFTHPGATAIWPATGITLVIFLILGYRPWPGIFLGAFFVNITTVGSIATSIGIATGNTLEGIVGAYLVNRFAWGRKAFVRAHNIFRFAILAGLLSTIVSASFGATSLSLGGFVSWSQYRPLWLTWWLGDAAGTLVFAPLLILWISSSPKRWNFSGVAELIVLTLGLVLVSQIVFGPSFFPQGKYPLEYLCIPFLIWAAFRFSQREAATIILLLFGIAVGGTLEGYGPFVRGSHSESLLLLQTYMGVVAMMTHTFAALTAERQRVEERVRYLAVTDGLTGLSNYRKFLDMLDAEVKRSGRTGRPFAVLLIDCDGLKKINDKSGHLTGSRALCRVANVLRVHCRSIDTAARYGGDEFAMIIPEAGAEAAQQVADRIRERVASDGEQPTLSISVGVAAYPMNGTTIETLLGAADRALYEMKRLPQQRNRSAGEANLAERTGAEPL
jgi:diguanylate cyclase (GGDEF)-like protein